MVLDKQQSLIILYNNNKFESIKNRYKYVAKTRAQCISCLKPIYVSFKQFGRNSIFCKECWKHNQQSFTIAQFHYIKKIKEEQLKFIEESTNISTNIISNE